MKHFLTFTQHKILQYYWTEQTPFSVSDLIKKAWSCFGAGKKLGCSFCGLRILVCLNEGALPCRAGGMMQAKYIFKFSNADTGPATYQE